MKVDFFCYFLSSVYQAYSQLFHNAEKWCPLELCPPFLKYREASW